MGILGRTGSIQDVCQESARGIKKYLEFSGSTENPVFQS